MEMALNCKSFDDIGVRIETLLKTQPPGSLVEKLRLLFSFKEMAALIPKRSVKRPARSRFSTIATAFSIFYPY
jgi:3-polyprenyl-4-hydroxybenzoate decarboxylase